MAPMAECSPPVQRVRLPTKESHRVLGTEELVLCRDSTCLALPMHGLSIFKQGW